MKKKRAGNVKLSPPIDNTGGDGFVFIYWDDIEVNKDIEDIEELIIFNSIDDTHRPEELKHD